MITNIVSNLVICIHLIWRDIPIYKNLYKNFKIKDFLHVLKEYKDYVLFQYPSNFIDNASYEYLTQYLGRVFSSQALGSYAMCIRVLKYPLKLIAAPISTVYFQTASEYHRQGRNLAEFTYILISRILIISVIPVAVFCYFSEEIFTFVLGNTWQGAGTIAAILSVQYVMMFCSQCTSYCRVAIEKQKVNLVFSCIRLAAVVVSASIGYAVFGTVIGTIIFLSITQSMCWILDMSLNFYCMNKKCLYKYLCISILYTLMIYAVVILKSGVRI